MIKHGDCVGRVRSDDVMLWCTFVDDFFAPSRPSLTLSCLLPQCVYERHRDTVVLRKDRLCSTVCFVLFCYA